MCFQPVGFACLIFHLLMLLFCGYVYIDLLKVRLCHNFLTCLLTFTLYIFHQFFKDVLSYKFFKIFFYFCFACLFFCGQFKQYTLFTLSV